MFIWHPLYVWLCKDELAFVKEVGGRVSDESHGMADSVFAHLSNLSKFPFSQI